MVWGIAGLLLVLPPLKGQGEVKGRPAVQEVSVVSTLVPIPDLPETVELARAKFEPLRRGMALTMAELEKDLTRLCQEAMSLRSAFLEGLLIPRRDCPEARQLMGFLDKGAGAQAAAEVHARWGEWQSDILKAALEDPKDGPGLRTRRDRMPFVPRFLCPLPFDPERGIYCTLRFQDGNTTHNLRLAQGLHIWLALGEVPYQRASPLGQAVLRASRKHVPLLRAHWRRWLEALNAAALAWMDYETHQDPNVDPRMKALRSLVKFQFLEQFRHALWFAQIIWAHMASEPLPKVD